ncbi:Hypothetical protein R9X50_00285000 [Acrodontium crateriforme]|uniref:IMS import disulfide relay-system CHCH-CHCH-like Cx9C domain-containing protein n=1 Tax=Acrodontium crateriforme TaxID=150365 RepID=A0AAQ3M1N1_9PEZI|nr:Hypothetical protein R9X50_00285000 [Acrodontium crateriforme]
MPTRTRPIEKFAEAIAKCSPEGAVYGKCISANYQNVHKDMCAKEFMLLKDCYLASLRTTNANGFGTNIEQKAAGQKA